MLWKTWKSTSKKWLVAFQCKKQISSHSKFLKKIFWPKRKEKKMKERKQEKECQKGKTLTKLGTGSHKQHKAKFSWNSDYHDSKQNLIKKFGKEYYFEEWY